MQIMSRETGELIHEFRDFPLSRLMQIRQQHQTLTPARYTFMIMGDDLLEFTT